MERATEKVVYNVKQRLTATVATQTETPRAAPTKTVEVQVQVNLEKKVSVATQTEQLDDAWVSEPDTEQPMNELENVDDILSCLCATWRPYIVPNSTTDQTQATEPPVPFETAKKRKRRGNKQKDKGASFGYM